MPDDEWFQVEVDVASTELDALSGALWSAGVAGIEERRTGTATRLVVAVPRAAGAAVQRLLDGRGSTMVPVAADSGLDAWRAHAEPVQVGDVAVVPAWRPRTSGAPLVVTIDPGRSFGSGSHVTTRLALALLQDRNLDGARVLDVGTGSGVLAIVAAKLGARAVVAVDIDPTAVDATRANAVANDVADRVDVGLGAPDAVAPSFDVVVANITASVLVDIAPSLLSRLRPGGGLLLSGVLTDRVDEVRVAYGGVRWVVALDDDGWTALSGVRSG